MVESSIAVSSLKAPVTCKKHGWQRSALAAFLTFCCIPYRLNEVKYGHLWSLYFIAIWSCIIQVRPMCFAEDKGATLRKGWENNSFFYSRIRVFESKPEIALNTWERLILVRTVVQHKPTADRPFWFLRSLANQVDTPSVFVKKAFC